MLNAIVPVIIFDIQLNVDSFSQTNSSHAIGVTQ